MGKTQKQRVTRNKLDQINEENEDEIYYKLSQKPIFKVSRHPDRKSCLNDVKSEAKSVDDDFYQQKDYIEQEDASYQMEHLYEDQAMSPNNFDIDEEKQRQFSDMIPVSLEEVKDKKIKKQSNEQDLQKFDNEADSPSELPDINDYLFTQNHNGSDDLLSSASNELVKKTKGKTKKQDYSNSEFQLKPSLTTTDKVKNEEQIELENGIKNKKKNEFEFYQHCIQSGTPVNKGPRRPLSPYIFFSQEKRKELKRINPEWNSSQIMKQVSNIWQKMSTDEKLKFQELSKDDRSRYENERVEFVQKKEQNQDEDDHNIIDTVRKRAQIAEEQKKRKKSEDFIHMSARPKKTLKKIRKGSHQVEKKLRKFSRASLMESSDKIDDRSIKKGKDLSSFISQSQKAKDLDIEPSTNKSDRLMQEVQLLGYQPGFKRDMFKSDIFKSDSLSPDRRFSGQQMEFGNQNSPGRETAFTAMNKQQNFHAKASQAMYYGMQQQPPSQMNLINQQMPLYSQPFFQNYSSALFLPQNQPLPSNNYQMQGSDGLSRGYQGIPQYLIQQQTRMILGQQQTQPSSSSTLNSMLPPPNYQMAGSGQGNPQNPPQNNFFQNQGNSDQMIGINNSGIFNMVHSMSSLSNLESKSQNNSHLQVLPSNMSVPGLGYNNQFSRGPSFQKLTEEVIEPKANDYSGNGEDFEDRLKEYEQDFNDTNQILTNNQNPSTSAFFQSQNGGNVGRM